MYSGCWSDLSACHLSGTNLPAPGLIQKYHTKLTTVCQRTNVLFNWRKVRLHKAICNSIYILAAGTLLLVPSGVISVGVGLYRSDFDLASVGAIISLCAMGASFMWVDVIKRLN